MTVVALCQRSENQLAHLPFLFFSIPKYLLVACLISLLPYFLLKSHFLPLARPSVSSHPSLLLCLDTHSCRTHELTTTLYSDRRLDYDNHDADENIREYQSTIDCMLHLLLSWSIRRTDSRAHKVTGGDENSEIKAPHGATHSSHSMCSSYISTGTAPPPPPESTREAGFHDHRPRHHNMHIRIHAER